MSTKEALFVKQILLVSMREKYEENTHKFWV